MHYREMLQNGLRVVCEEIPYVKSVSIGLWIAAGTRHEEAELNGISHFIEHMMFKGTKRRSARNIAEEVDNVGGQLNAFTGKECTCYYAKMLNTHLELAFDILSDMIFNSTFLPDEIEKEKNVVLEEINMYEDTPEEVVHDLFTGTLFKGHPLGYPVLGSSTAVNSIKRNDILNFIHKNYQPQNTVISVAGNVKFGQVVEMAKKYFGDWKRKQEAPPVQSEPTMNFELRVKRKDTEQVHFCIGFKGYSQKDENLYPFLALNNLLGGGMSSRLFQKIREDLGLVYSVYSYPSTYSDTGLMAIYAGTNPSQLYKVIRYIKRELSAIKKEGITLQELNRVKEQMKGNYIMSLESTGSRMSSMGKSELLLGKVYTPEEVLEKIDSITLDSIMEVTENVINFDCMAAAVLGDIEGDLIKTMEEMEC